MEPYYGYHNVNECQLHQHDPVWEAPLRWRSEFLNVLLLYNRKKISDYDDSVKTLDFAGHLIGARERKAPSLKVPRPSTTSSCPSYDGEFVWPKII